MEAYCLKCRSKKEVKDAEAVTLKNGRPATRGKCSQLFIFTHGLHVYLVTSVITIAPQVLFIL